MLTIAVDCATQAPVAYWGAPRAEKDAWDRALVLHWLACLQGRLDASSLVLAVMRGEPRAKERARFSARSGRWFTPDRTRGAEADLSFVFSQALQRRPALLGPVAVASVFQFSATQAQPDADNCVKLLWDAATKAGVWQDDRQVRQHVTFTGWDAADPRTVVAIAPCAVLRGDGPPARRARKKAR